MTGLVVRKALQNICGPAICTHSVSEKRLISSVSKSREKSSLHVKDVPWESLYPSTPKVRKIQVLTGGNRKQPTFNGSDNCWSFESSPSPCPKGEVFLIETNGVSTTIKANNTKMYLSMTVDGVGVPDSYPKFTNRHANGSSTTVVEGYPVTISKYDQHEDIKSRLTAFSFTVKYEKEEHRFFFVPGADKIEVMETDTPQYYFVLKDPSSDQANTAKD